MSNEAIKSTFKKIGKLSDQQIKDYLEVSKSDKTLVIMGIAMEMDDVDSVCENESKQFVSEIGIMTIEGAELDHLYKGNFAGRVQYHLVVEILQLVGEDAVVAASLNECY